MRKTPLVAAVMAACALLAGCDQSMMPHPTKPPVTSTTAPSNPGNANSFVPAGYTLVAGDDFNYTGKPKSNWGIYNGAGHGGKGRRTPDAFSVDGSVLTVTGDSAGNTGGMAWKNNGQQYGYWEARVKAPKGASTYHPVLLLWPDAEDWPVGGEVDYYEVFGSERNKVNFFLHYSASNSQTSGSKGIDLTQWRTVGVLWTPNGMTGYIDGVKFFEDTNKGHLPPRKMHMTIQLDYFPGDGSGGAASMQVDYIKQYKNG